MKLVLLVLYRESDMDLLALGMVEHLFPFNVGTEEKSVNMEFDTQNEVLHGNKVDVHMINGLPSCLLQYVAGGGNNNLPWEVLALVVTILNHLGLTLAGHELMLHCHLSLLESLLGLNWKIDAHFDKKIA